MIGITIGDPSGIGPEVSLGASAAIEKKGFLIIGPSRIIQRERERLGIKDLPAIEDVRADFEIEYGTPSKQSGEIAYKTILHAINLLKENRISSLVTAPVSKQAICMAGHDFRGHTEMIARSFGVRRYTMLFCSKGLNVAIVTRHIPLSRVSKELSVEMIYNTIEQGSAFVSRHSKILGLCQKPRIGVLGLNPHSGEGGSIGDEEEKFIIPAIDMAKRRGIDASGPLAPDTAYREDFDLFIAMYHDQGLIPVKLLSFENAVNVTIGLPFLRTSPPHGTAFDIAGKGIADLQPMKNAIELAIRLERGDGKTI